MSDEGVANSTYEADPLEQEMLKLINAYGQLEPACASMRNPELAVQFSTAISLKKIAESMQLVSNTLSLMRGDYAQFKNSGELSNIHDALAGVAQCVDFNYGGIGAAFRTKGT